MRRRMKPGGIAQSAGLMAGAQLLAKLVDILTLLVLARVLMPGDFGLVALASAVLLSLAAVTEVPLTEALIQRRTAAEADLSAAFTLSLLRGLLAAALLTALAAPLARLFGEPRLGAVLTTFALIPLAQGCASPAMVHALRALDYRALACSQLCGKLAACGVMLSVALAGGGVGALVAGLVAGPLVTALSTHLLAPWRLRLSLRGAAGLFHFAGWVSLSRMIFTLNQQSDRFFIGAILGRPQLGLYTMAGDLASLATHSLAAPAAQPLFAGFAALRDAPARLRESYLRAQQILLCLIAPTGLLFAVFAADLVPLVLGAGWSAMVPLIWWLAPVIALQAVTLPAQALLMALGKPKSLVFRESLSLALRLPATLLAALFLGLTGAAAARSLAALVMIAVMLRLGGTEIGLSAGEQLRRSGRIFCALALMMAGVVPAALAWSAPETTAGALLRLSALCGLGLLIYGLSLFLLHRHSGRAEGVADLIRRIR
ncbi:oligosaccharide flippase family protein [Falsigemmobacter intermedius]|uniref:oligosaccharide flippase family protein n=1 Tax=Falsigemmobacter intermedius TaxID=1553448 RepID=UPI003F056122